MKSIFKFTVLITLSIFASCTKGEVNNTKLHYDLDHSLETSIEVEVIPMEGIQVDMQEMSEEVNADYFNRYGVSIGFEMLEGESLPQWLKEEGGMFLPAAKSKDKVSLYVVPDSYVRFEINGSYRTANGYAARGGNVVVVSESSYKSSTVAHELGHIFGLGHHGSWNDNVMGQYSTKEQYDIPSEFLQHQVDSININLEQRSKINNWNASAKSSINNNIILN